MIHHINDDFKNPKLNFRRYIEAVPYYHVHLSIHSVHMSELKALGAQNVVKTFHGFDPEYCFPEGKMPQPDPSYSSDVIFVGHHEQRSEDYVLHLIENGVDIKVWGWRWERSKNKHRFADRVMFTTLGYPDYARAIASAKIALGFVSEANRNQSTIRSFEIPAIGTFMLGERTKEHLSLYEEGREAEFFDSREELLAKVHFFLKHDEKRKSIAAAGHRRALTSGYSYLDRIRTDLENIMPIYQQSFPMGRITTRNADPNNDKE